MNVIRRKLLKSTALFSAIGAGLLVPGRAISAYLADAFEAKDIPGALKAAVGSDTYTASSEIKLKAPDIAENGAVVPITVSSTLPNIDSITIMAPKNPSPMTSTYILQNGAEPFVSTRIKLRVTSDIIAVVRSNGQLFSATKEVKVTIGGCGG